MKNLSRIAAVAIATVALSFLLEQRAEAMPPFAQAYGVKCNVCHTQVPALNTYGRYVQRTGYASLDPHVLRRAFPVWVGESANYDTGSGSYKIQFGNLAIHAVGPLGDDITYHFQQWILAGDQAGDLDTFWGAYNNLLHRDGHLFVGKVEAPGPSPFSQWMDLAPFVVPEITVGEHVYELDANRWGAKFNYVKGALDVEAGWLYNSGGWSGSSGFINTDKTFQYKVAYANPEKPVEAGIYGSRGSWPLAEGGFDQYWSIAGYAERDPFHGIPGILGIYQIALDGNPGYTSTGGYATVAQLAANNQQFAQLFVPFVHLQPLAARGYTAPAPGLVPLGSAGSNGVTLELYQPVLDKGLLSVRKEWTNDGLGTLQQSGNIDFNYQIARYVHAYVEEYWASHTTPNFAYMLWWTTPVTVVK